MKKGNFSVRTAAAWVVLALILCQFIPLDRLGQQSEPSAAIPRDVRGVLEARCFQCHSGNTDWPKTAYLAPLSWYVTGKVHEARNALNFSDYDTRSDAGRGQIRRETARFIESAELSAHGRIPGFPEVVVDKREKLTLIEWSANNNREQDGTINNSSRR
ncbi:MAG: heme-binding domain-containing protein [Chlorobiaceae bacterium]|nr:heme-binding domain-containing protein [Chlorobiaceae bacterium]